MIKRCETYATRSSQLIFFSPFAKWKNGTYNILGWEVDEGPSSFVCLK